MRGRILIGIMSMIILLVCIGCSLDSLSDYKPKGERKAIVVGMSYIDVPEVLDLPYAKADAEDMDIALSTMGYQVTALAGKGFSQEEIIGEIEKLNTLQQEDKLIFFFAGHGDNTKGVHTLITVNDDNQYENTLCSNTLLEALSKTPAQVLVILDICFAGGFIPSDPYTHDSVYTTQRFRYPRSESLKHAVDAFFSRATPPDTPLWVLTATGFDEEAYEPKENGDVYDSDGKKIENGFFTHHLLKGLGVGNSGYFNSDANSDGVLLVSELYAFVLSEFRKEGYYGYLPHISGGPLDMILAPAQ